jgi:hypothetical protein
MCRDVDRPGQEKTGKNQNGLHGHCLAQSASTSIEWISRIQAEHALADYTPPLNHHPSNSLGTRKADGSVYLPNTARASWENEDLLVGLILLILLATELCCTSSRKHNIIQRAKARKHAHLRYKYLDVVYVPPGHKCKHSYVRHCIYRHHLLCTFISAALYSCYGYSLKPMRSHFAVLPMLPCEHDITQGPCALKASITTTSNTMGST